jgi:hypothetical protein
LDTARNLDEIPAAIHDFVIHIFVVCLGFGELSLIENKKQIVTNAINIDRLFLRFVKTTIVDEEHILRFAQ